MKKKNIFPILVLLFFLSVVVTIVLFVVSTQIWINQQVDSLGSYEKEKNLSNNRVATIEEEIEQLKKEEPEKTAKRLRNGLENAYLKNEGEQYAAYLKQLAEGNVSAAQYVLGCYYEEYSPIQDVELSATFAQIKDVPEALNWYLKAAGQGNLDAEKRLCRFDFDTIVALAGLYYSGGKGFPKDAKNADALLANLLRYQERTELEKAFGSIVDLAWMYSCGENGFPRDAGKMEEMFERALSHWGQLDPEKVSDSMIKLARMYYGEENGFPKGGRAEQLLDTLLRCMERHDGKNKRDAKAELAALHYGGWNALSNMVIPLMIELGRRYYTGEDGFPKDAKKAEATLDNALQRLGQYDQEKVFAAEVEISRLYYSGEDGFPKDAGKAEELLDNNALKRVKSLDQEKIFDSSAKLARLYYSGGDGFPKDAGKAEELLETSLKDIERYDSEKNLEMIIDLAGDYYSGRDGFPKDVGKAEKLLLVAGKTALGQAEVIRSFARGEHGLPKDVTEARTRAGKYADRSGIKGWNNAMIVFSAFYRNGENGFSKDAGKAEQMLEIAEEISVEPAFTLSRIIESYVKGYHGLPKDMAEAEKWLEKLLHTPSNKINARGGSYIQDVISIYEKQNPVPVDKVIKLYEKRAEVEPHFSGVLAYRYVHAFDYGVYDPTGKKEKGGPFLLSSKTKEQLIAEGWLSRGEWPQNSQETIKWCLKAEEYFKDGSYFKDIGLMYEEGRPDLPRDEKEAKKWFEKAEKNRKAKEAEEAALD